MCDVTWREHNKPPRVGAILAALVIDKLGVSANLDPRSNRGKLEDAVNELTVVQELGRLNGMSNCPHFVPQRPL